MTKTLLILLCLLAGNAFPKGKAVSPGLCNVSVGASRASILEILKTSPVFSAAEITVDTNAILVNSGKESLLLCDSLRIASLKFLFNKKPVLQGMNVIFPAANGTELEKIVLAVNTLLGPPKNASSEKIGFHYEAEWVSPPYDASFFASDQAFEAYLLLGYSSFVKEEEARSMKFEK